MKIQQQEPGAKALVFSSVSHVTFILSTCLLSSSVVCHYSG